MKAVFGLMIIAWAAFLYWGNKEAAKGIASCRAIQDLPANHRLAAVDLRCIPPEAALLLAGSYVKEKTAANAVLDLGNLMDAPSLRLPSDRFFAAVPIDSSLPPVDAGSRIAVSAEGKIVTSDALVIAVSCPGRDPSNCTAILGMPAKAAEGFPVSQLKLSPASATGPQAAASNQGPHTRAQEGGDKPQKK